MVQEQTAIPGAPDDCARAFRASGKPADLGALYDATAAELFRVALALAPDPASAEDALQETYLTASAILDRWDESRPVLPWLLGILRLKVHEVRRRARRVPRAARSAAARPMPAEDGPGEGEANAAQVRAAIDALAEPYRSVAILRWRYGLTPAQIADARNEAPGTTSSILSRALDRLRRAFRGLPAAFFGPRAPRGLDALRESVLQSVAAGAVAVAAAAIPLWLVAAVVLAVAGGGWLIVRGVAGSWGHAESPGVAAATTTDGGGDGPGLAAHPAPARGGGGLAASSRERAVGAIVDGAGRPIAGARVVAFPGDAETVTLEAAAGSTSATTTTGDGAFEIPVETASTFATLVVAAPGFPPHVRPGAALGRPVEVVLEAACALEGRVLAVDGSPVPGARIRVVGRLGPVPYEAETIASATGDWRVDGLPPAPTRHPERSRVQYVIAAGADGFAPSVVRAYPLPAGGTTRVDVVLARGGVAEGRVVDAESGRPIPGAEIATRTFWGFEEVNARGRGTSRTGAGPRDLLGVTGPDGSWRAEHVASLGERSPDHEGWSGSDRGYLTASAPGYAVEFGKLPPPGPDGVARLEFGLSPTATVTGRVVDEAGSPVAGARAGVRTDAAGHFTAEVKAKRAETTRVDLHVSPPEGSWLDDARAGGVSVRAGEVTEIREPIVLARRAFRERTLLVTDERGHPVLGAHVGEWEWADRGGRIVVRDLPERLRPDPLVVEAEGLVKRAVPAEAWDADGSLASIVLSAGRRLVGNVVTKEGRPVPDADVFAVDPSVPEADLVKPPTFDNWNWLWTSATTYGCAHTDAAGAYRIDDVPSGSLRLLARKGIDARSWPRGGSVWAACADVPPGAAEATVTLPAEALVETATLSGEIIDEVTGRPLAARTDVRLERDGESFFDQVWHGPRFSIAGVPVGTWTLHADAPGWARTTMPGVQVAPGAAPLRVALTRGLSLHGRVTLPDGVSPEHRVLRFTRLERDAPTGSTTEAPLGRDGTWEAAGFVPGDYNLLCVWIEPEINDRVGWLAPREGGRITVPEGATGEPLDLSLVPAAWLEVGIHDPRLLPALAFTSPLPFDPEKAQLSSASHYTVLDVSGRAVAAAYRLRDGHQQTHVLPRGTYTVRLDMPDAPVETRTVRLGDDPDPRVWFDHRPAARTPPPRAPAPAKVPPAK